MLLVTGGAGFIGSNFVIHRLREGIDQKILVMDKLNYAGDVDNLECVKDRIIFVQSDIGSDSVPEILREYGVTAVVNFAAETHVDNSIRYPEIFVDANILQSFRFIKNCNEYYAESGIEGFRFIHISTDEVFGSLNWDDPPKDEDSLHLPNNPYSASKASTEMIVRAFVETYGFPAIITNCSNNYGLNHHREKFIPRVILQCLNNGEVPIFGEGKNIRDWVHVNDHCSAISLILKKGLIGERYCIGGECEISNIDLARKICSLMDQLMPREDGKSYSSLIRFVPDRQGHDTRYALNPAKIKKLGWKVKSNLDQGLIECMNWFSKKRKSKYSKIVILGAGGKLGREITEQLKSKEGFLLFPFNRNELDIRDSKAVADTLTQCSPELLINCSAYTAVDTAESEIQEARSVNEEAVANLAETCDRLNIKLIHFSTDYVFDGKKSSPYKEEDEPNPLNVYGLTKLGGEIAITERMNNYLIIRVGWLYSKFGSNFVKNMINLFKDREALSIVNDQIGSPTSTRILASTSLDLMDQKGIFHISNRGQCSWFELTQEIYLLAKEKYKIKTSKISAIKTSEYSTYSSQYPYSPTARHLQYLIARRPCYSKLDSSKAENVLGYSFPDWREELRLNFESIFSSREEG